MRKQFIYLLTFSIITIFFLFGQGAAQPPSSFEIPLKSGTITLQRGSIDPAGSRYVIVQFDRVLSQEETMGLRTRGVNPLSFLYSKAWLCAAEPSSFTATVIKEYSIAAVAPWKLEYKVSIDLITGKFEEWAVTESGQIKLLVSFFEDVGQSNMESLVRQYSSTYAMYSKPNIWAIQVSPLLINSLINETIIKSIIEGPAPSQPLNDLSRWIINVDPVQDIITSIPPVYNGLSGRGIIVEVREPTPPPKYVYIKHPDFFNKYDVLGNPIMTSSRFLNPFEINEWFYHATHVAGIIGGNGWNSDKNRKNTGIPYQWRGMAPEVSLITSLSDGAAYGSVYYDRVDVSNHSYVMDSGKQGYGKYGTNASIADKEIRGGSGVAFKKPHIWGVGNQGVKAQYDNEEGYYSIYAPAKNAIGVGAVNTNDNSLASFSSLGPTFDGRIKPDVMAGGCKNTLPLSLDTSKFITVDIDYIRILEHDNTIVQNWEFNENGNFEGWKFSEEIYNPMVSDGYLSFQTKIETGKDEGMAILTNISIEANDSQIVKIKYRIDAHGTEPFIQKSSLKWTTVPSGLNYIKGSIDYRIHVDNEFHEASVSVGEFGLGNNVSGGNTVKGWQGSIKDLLSSRRPQLLPHEVA